MADRHRVLNPDGKLADGAQPKLASEQVLDGLRWMLLSRAFDAKAVALQRQGKIGTVSPVAGQEATVVGAALALNPQTDWVVPSYRELPALVRQGYPMERLFGSLLGKGLASAIPEGVNVLPNQVAIATQLPHAAGLAWGLKLQGKEGVVMAFCGEGASSEGDFHEACNLAGVMKAPIVFLLQNNQWAISTGRNVQSAGDFYKRAAGYGFPGRCVDGNDLIAVYEVASEAVERARKGEGPTLIESQTYRMSFHNTTDNPKAYLPEGWLEKAEKEDPVRRVEAYLAAQGLWDEATAAAVNSEIQEQVEGAVTTAMEMPVARPENIFDHVYVTPPQRVIKQREELINRDA